MSRKRKTRKEKLLISLKKQLPPSLPSETISRSTPPANFTSTFSVPTVNQPVWQPKNYSYVLTDVKKTVSIVSVLFIINIILYIVMQFKIWK